MKRCDNVVLMDIGPILGVAALYGGWHRKSWTALVLTLALLSEDNLRNKDPEMIFWGLYREALTPKCQL